jgi:histidinol-phosphate aminotransferase
MTSKALQQRLEQWVRPDILAQQAYPVPSAEGLIKLDAMENPYTWPDAMRAAWAAELQAVTLNRYPSAQASELKAALRQHIGLSESYDLLLGNGSDEIIQLLLMTVSASGRTIMTPEPGFVMFRIIAQSLHLDFAGLPLDADFNLDMPACLAAIAEHQPAVIFLAQPNNPTGNVWPEADLRALIEAAPGVVVLDEAYTAFTDTDFLSWLDDYEHLLVMRTLSKVGLAGLRLGLLMGRPQWLEHIDKVRLPYNINTLTQASAQFALQHFAELSRQTDLIRAERERMMQALAALPLVRIWPSEANFILVRTPADQARACFEICRTQGILIKCVDGAHPLLKDCLRLTIGQPEENSALLRVLAHALTATA